MRNLRLLTPLLVCLSIMARGQTGFDYHYWFDDATQPKQTVHRTSNKWNTNINVKSLSEGLHWIYFMVSQDSCQSQPVYRPFVKLAGSSASTMQAIMSIDGQVIHSQEVPPEGGVLNLDLDVSSLSEGLHRFAVIASVPGQGMSEQHEAFFYHAGDAGCHAAQCVWAIDDGELHHQSSNLGNGTFCFKANVASISEGLHEIKIVLLDEDGNLLDHNSQFFMKVGGSSVESTQCIWAIDGGELNLQAQNLGNGIFTFNANVASLSDGLHEMLIVLLDEGGNLLDHRSQFFYKGSNTGVQKAQCIWAIDGGELHRQAQNLSNGTFTFNANVASIPDGLHEIKITLLDEGGNLLDHRSEYFIKRTNESTAIARYNVWVNDDIDNASNVVINPAQDPYSLMSLLPVGHPAFRTSNFHFEFDSQNQPMLYARNDLHVRFHDVMGRLTTVSAPFIDYTVSCNVTDVSLLVSGESQTHPYPAQNTIKWFKFDAAKGDSLSLKTDRACTIQLFSPSGKELYNASGADVVNWGGASGDTDGTYYVALHDVTATQGSEVTIDYLHIDRYAILGQDVNHVGNGGYSTITFDGNGFNELNDVELVCGSNTIHAAYIGHEHNGTTTVTFDFNGAALGNYNAKFIFEEGTVNVINCITVETAIEPEIELDVQYANTFIIGTSNTYHFKVHNKGNMTAYDVPLFFYIYSPDTTSVSYISVSGYNMNDDFKEFIGDIYNSDVEEKIERIRAISGDMLYFFKIHGTEYVPHFPYLYWGYMHPNVRPNKTEEFDVKVSSTNSIYVLLVQLKEDNQTSPQINENIIMGAGLMPKQTQNATDFAECIKNQKINKDNMFDDSNSFFENQPNSYCDKPPQNGDNVAVANGNAVVNHDPNDIYGYLAESGSHAIGAEVNEVNYRIEFENDTTFATANAHDIWVTDTLDATRFDLSSFAPMSIKIGNRTEVLDGSPSFIRTIDMRPEIYAIAQVECNYNAAKGIAQWHLSSLDPMTMEPVSEVHQGILPVNYDGVSGVGEVSFNISLRDNLGEGTTISNRAGIVFDYNDVIMTPAWVNVIDLTAPTSHATSCELVNDSIAAVTIEASDNLSGPWRYDVMVQYGEGSDWFAAARAVPADSIALVRVYEGIDHNFCVVLTDSAGNVENKSLEPELSFDYFDSSTNSELTLALAKNWNWMSHNLNAPLEVTALQPNAYRIVGQEGETIKDPSYGYTGTINTLDPTKLYKVQMTKAANVQLQGKLYNVAFKSTDLSAGWNWLGYPLAAKLAPSVALANLDAQDGDCILGQDGMTMFNNGQWSGTLSQLKPGKGYMLKIQSNATLHWNAPRVSSSQHAPGSKNNGDAAPYSVDAYLYPNVMGIVADLYDSGSPVDPDDYWLVAFCGEECRGVAQTVDGHLMMNIYGNSGETVTFKVIDRNTQAVDDVAEKRAFAQDVEGTLQTPLVLNIGTSGLSGLTVKGLRVYPTVTKGDVNVTTSYGDIESVEVLNAKGQTVMSLQNMGSSAVVGLSDLPDGIYMIRVTTDNGTSTTKVVKQK